MLVYTYFTTLISFQIWWKFRDVRIPESWRYIRHIVCLLFPVLWVECWLDQLIDPWLSVTTVPRIFVVVSLANFAWDESWIKVVGCWGQRTRSELKIDPWVQDRFQNGTVNTRVVIWYCRWWGGQFRGEWSRERKPINNRSWVAD